MLNLVVIISALICVKFHHKGATESQPIKHITTYKRMGILDLCLLCQTIEVYTPKYYTWVFLDAKGSLFANICVARWARRAYIGVF